MMWLSFKVLAKEIEKGREVEDLIRIILRQFTLCQYPGSVWPLDGWGEGLGIVYSLNFRQFGQCEFVCHHWFLLFRYKNSVCRI